MKQLRVKAILVAGTALLLTLYPFIISYYFAGLSSCFSWFAADAFYYLAVAKNLSWSPIFSFDSIHPTNGFHPLWQAYLKTSFTVFPTLSDNQPAQLLFTYWSCALCIAVAAAILSLVVLKLTRSLSLSLISIVPGFLYFTLALHNQHLGALWSYVNGTESAFSLLLFACLVAFMLKFRVYDSEKLRTYIPVGIIVSALVLARLDDIFIIPALCFPLLFSQMSLSAKFSRWLILVGCPALVVLMYCAFNLAYAKTPLPVSGELKGDLAIMRNLFGLVNTVLPLSVVLTLDQLKAGDWTVWRFFTGRALHNFLPFAASVGFLFVAFRRYRFFRLLPNNTQSLLVALSLYVVGKAAYNFVFVYFSHQGHWYYPVSICVANILVAVWLSRAKAILSLSIQRRRVTRKIVPIGFGISLLFVLYTANAMMATKAVDPNQGAYQFWLHRESTTRQIRQQLDGKGILSFDDGIVAYSLDLPVMSGLGFTLDYPAVQAKKVGTLLDVAYERGFRWLTSVYYMPPLPTEVGKDVTADIRKARFLEDENINKWTFRLVYVHPKTGDKFIEFEPRANPTTMNSRLQDGLR